jgi:hypothetical protein
VIGKAKPMKNREAACSCGQLRLTCLDDPVRVSMCHCLECQHRTGSPFGVQAWYLREQVLPARGVAKRYERQADSGRTVTFNFSAECGGTVFWVAELRPDLSPSQWVCLLIPNLKDPVFRSGRAGSVLDHRHWRTENRPYGLRTARSKVGLSWSRSDAQRLPVRDGRRAIRPRRLHGRCPISCHDTELLRSGGPWRDGGCGARTRGKL